MTSEDLSYPQPPQVAAKRPTPEVVQREIRKFALEQAIKALPHIHPMDALSGVVGVAAKFEDYILNGTADE